MRAPFFPAARLKRFRGLGCGAELAGARLDEDVEEEEAEAESETNLLRTFDPTEKRDAGAGVKYGANGSLGFGCVC